MPKVCYNFAMQRQFTVIMSLCLVLFGGIFAFTIIKLNPTQGLFALIAFYLSTALVILSFFSLLSFFARRLITNNESHFSNIKVSFRQSLILALFVDLTLFIASINLLTWWDIVLLGLSLVLLELYFESNKVKPIDSKRQAI